MPFKLPDLPYAYDALEPYIDKLTMEIHHTKHHQAYVDNLNKALESQPELLDISVEDLMSKIETVKPDLRQVVINNGGGHANHSFFWKIMSQRKTSSRGEPEGDLKITLEDKFGSLDKFKEEFTGKAMGVFGSGWAFLVLNAKGELELTRHSFQNSPLMDGNVPVLGLDVWEHAYYLKYQNRKAEYVSAWWQIVNWKQVETNYINALKK